MSDTHKILAELLSKASDSEGTTKPEEPSIPQQNANKTVVAPLSVNEEELAKLLSLSMGSDFKPY